MSLLLEVWSWVLSGGVIVWGLLSHLACSAFSAVVSTRSGGSKVWNWLGSLVDFGALNIFRAENSEAKVPVIYEQLKKRTAEHAKDVSNWRTSNDLYRKDIALLKRKLGEQEQAKKSARCELAESERTVRDLMADNKRLNSELSDFTEENSSLLGELGEVKEANMRLCHELADVKKAAARVKKVVGVRRPASRIKDVRKTIRRR